MARPRKRTRKATLTVGATSLFFALEEDLDACTQRGFVLACAAAVDIAVEQLIRAKLRLLAPDAEKDTNLLLSDGEAPPLRSAKLRVRFARVLGIIDKPTADALIDLYSIRNDFAHTLEPPPLDESEAKALWTKLPKAYQKGLQDALDRAGSASLPPESLLKQAGAALICILRCAANHIG